MSLLARTTRSAAWTSSVLPITTLAAFATSIVVAQRMSTHALGQYALVALIVTLVSSGATLVSGNFYVILPSASTRVLRTALTLELVIGVGAWVLIAAGAAAYTLLGGQSEFAAFLLVEALVLPLAAFGNPYGPLVASFTRDFAYKTPTLVFLAFALASAATKIALVILGLGVWGLIIGDVVLAAGFGIAMLVLVPDGRRLAFDREAARRVLQFGIPSAATSLMGLLSERGSELIVAIFLGTRTLGVYFIAARLPAQLYQVGGNLSAPVLTAFSRSTQEQLGRGFVLATRFSAFFILLPLAFVIPLAQPFITTVYGDKWSAAAAPLVLLTAAIAVRLTFWHTANLLKSRGRVKEITVLTALQLVLVLGLAALGAWAFGAVGAAAAVLIVELVLAAAKIRLARSMVTFAAVRTLRAPLVALVFGALLAGAAAWLLEDAAALVVGAVLVCAAFAAIAWRSDRKTITAILAAFRRPAAGVG